MSTLYTKNPARNSGYLTLGDPLSSDSSTSGSTTNRRRKQRFVLRKKVGKHEKTLAEKYAQRVKGDTVTVTVEVSADAIMKFFEKNLKQTIENALK